MALDIVTGHTDDGLVFLKFNGKDARDARPLDIVITLEPDFAKGISDRMAEACTKAMLAKKRPLIVGEQQTFKKR